MMAVVGGEARVPESGCPWALGRGRELAHGISALAYPTVPTRPVAVALGAVVGLGQGPQWRRSARWRYPNCPRRMVRDHAQWRRHPAGSGRADGVRSGCPSQAAEPKKGASPKANAPPSAVTIQ
jgi:hypothetical protein